MPAISLSVVLIGLLTLIFSEVPFLNLIYVMVGQSLTSWDDFGVVTGAFFIAYLGATIYRRINK